MRKTLSFLNFYFICNLVIPQSNISRISIDLGLLKNAENEKEYFDAYYPELKLGGDLVKKGIEWELYTGFWRTSTNHKYNPTEYLTNWTIGTKFYVFPYRMIIPHYFYFGISHRNLHEENKIVMKMYHDIYSRTIHILSIDFGLGFKYEINRDFRFRTDANIYFPTKGDGYGGELMTASIKFGFDYFMH